jgi:hypothetical protein
MTAEGLTSENLNYRDPAYATVILARVQKPPMSA